ncbi:MAG: LPXTG cell wall anchor domain-containing protein [Lachnospiraceae bacterium]|nr:LPXTG cell wall anchor domain-containing protein [Lachnospiraceae bacterium]
MRDRKNNTKRHMMTRVLAWILVFALMMSSSSATAFAELGDSDSSGTGTEAGYTEDGDTSGTNEEQNAQSDDDESSGAEDDAAQSDETESADDGNSGSGTGDEEGADAGNGETGETEADDEDSAAGNGENDSSGTEEAGDDASEDEDTQDESTETAVLESSVVQTLYQDEEGNYFIAIEMTVQETASVAADGVSVKMILPAGLSVTEESRTALTEDGNVTVIDSVTDEVAAELEEAAEDEEYEMLLAELADCTDAELAAYGCAVVWSNQTVAAGGSNTYTLTVAVDEDVYDFESDGLFYVNGEALSSESIEWVTDYAVSAVDEEDETDSGGETGDGETEENTYDGTALKTYADELFETYGLVMTVTQNPESGEVLAGQAVTWYVTISIPVAENYSGFSSYNKTLWDSYEDLTVTLTAPSGITITNVSATGYTTNSDTFYENGTKAEVYLGNVAANATTISFSVTGYIDADPAPATGTTYSLTKDNITYSTNITVKDRDNSNAEVEQYSVTGTTETDLTDLTLTSTTNDTWELTKTCNGWEVDEKEDTLTVTYTIQLIMNEYTQLSQYTVNGRTLFKEFSIKDTPSITYGENTYYPTSVTVLNTSKSGAQESTTQDANGVQSVTITDYATLNDATEQNTALQATTSAGRPLDGDVPVLTTYTVTAVYKASDFTSPFYDVVTYEINNTADLNYTLEYADEDYKKSGDYTVSVSDDYSDPTDPAGIDLQKYIQSIYIGGTHLADYVDTEDLDSDYTGDATFTILNEDGSAATLYALIDTDDDGVEEYVTISNEITITRDADGKAGLYVTQLSDTEDEDAENEEEEASSNVVLSALASVANYVISLFSSNSSDSDGQLYEGLIYVNGGTYSISEENGVTNTSFTAFTSDKVTLTSTDGTTYSFTLTAGEKATITATNTETRGSISFYKEATAYNSSVSTGSLEGAVFGLYQKAEDSEELTEVTDSDGDAITQTSDGQGVVLFEKLEPGTYYIQEISAPDGYLLDDTVYEAIVVSNEVTSAFTDETGTVYNEKNAAALTFVKYLLSTDSNGNLIQVPVDQTRINTVFTTGVFVLQYSTDGSTWYDKDVNINIQRTTTGTGEEAVTVSASTTSGLPVYVGDDVKTPYYYRIVEYLPEGYSLVTMFTGEDGDITAGTETWTAEDDTDVQVVVTEKFTLVDGDTTVSLTNQTTGEVSVGKQYAYATAEGYQTKTATDGTETTVYLLKKTGTETYEVVGTAETGSDGVATVSNVDILGETNAQEYYWAEAVSNDAYSSYTLVDGTEVTVDIYDSKTGITTSTTLYLQDTVVYASAYESSSSRTTLVNILPYVRVLLEKKSTATEGYVEGAGYTVYRVVDEKEESEPYTDSLATDATGDVEEGGSTLVLEAGYIYHIYETTVPGNYSGLIDSDGMNEDGVGYIEIDLKNSVPDSYSSSGLGTDESGNLTYAAEGTFYDEPYPKLTLTKDQVVVNDSSVSTSTYNAEFAIYRSEDGDTYTLYQSSYTANYPVSLEPGYYYAFVENVDTDNDYLSPEDYAEYTGESVSVEGANFTQITIVDDSGMISSTSTAYAYVTTEKIVANTSGTTSYSIGTVTNYQNISSVTVTKYAYDDDSTGSQTLPGAVIGIYSDEECENEVDRGTTDAYGKVTFSGLAVYDENGEKITYYIKEIDAPDDYFESDADPLEVQLSVGTVTTTDTEDEALSIYDEPMLTVKVPVVWIDCDPVTDPSAWEGSALSGAWVYLYEAVYAEDGKTIVSYKLVDTFEKSELDDTGSSAYATFTGLRHNQDYIFVLGMSGVLDESASNYPLYASTDYSEDYLISAWLEEDEDGNQVIHYYTPSDELYPDDLKNLQYIKYNSDDITATKDVTDESLKNYHLYFEIDIQKYCKTNDHGDAREIEIELENGTKIKAWYVNGALFYLYRQALTEEELKTLSNGGSIVLTYDATKLELVTSDTSSDEGTAILEAVYDDTYVYWLVEASTGTGHTWAYATDEDGNVIYSNGKPTYESYYRILLYPKVLTEADGSSITATNATDVQSVTPNSVTSLNVENTCGSGSHLYMLSTVFMNKWGGYYDQYGVDTKDYSPLNGAEFSFSLSGDSNSIAIDDAQGQVTKGDIAVQAVTDEDDNSGTGNEEEYTQSDNNAGQVSTLFTFARLLNQWYVEVALAAGLDDVKTITDLTTIPEYLETLASSDVWTGYTGMLYASTSIDTTDKESLIDLAADNGAVAMQILYAFADVYPDFEIDLENGGDAPYETYVSYMENVLCENLDGYSDLNDTTYLVSYSEYGYKSYYAHIVITETDTPSGEYGKYEAVQNSYELYLQFRPTGANGLANIKYFYLDNDDRDDYYYNSDPASVDTMGLDASFDNTERTQILNMPVLKQNETVTKYGYTLTTATQGLTDDELDAYFEENSTKQKQQLTSTFILERYDTTGDTPVWRYYSADDCDYVDRSDDAQITTDYEDGLTLKLPLGYYRLTEVSVTDEQYSKNYENILNGEDVTVYDESENDTGTTAEAMRYFWVERVDDGTNTVNVYDPQSFDLYIEKYSLSNLSTKITEGIDFTLTNVDDADDTYTAVWNSSAQAWIVTGLPAGTYWVDEEVTTNTKVTDEYFERFQITVGYTRGASEGTAALDSSVTEYTAYVKDVSATLSGEAECAVSDDYEDSITSEVTPTGATATLKVHDPSTGSLTITKADANDSTATLSGAIFTLYYHAFSTDDDDAYIAETESMDQPTFDADNPTSNEWTSWGTTNATGSSGTVTITGLTPGWYAIVEDTAPAGYERSTDVKVVAVTADMTENHQLQNGDGSVAVTVDDVKKVSLSVNKTFNLEDFGTDLTDEAATYSVTFGLYVYDTDSGNYISAASIGLSDQEQITLKVTSNDSNTAVTGKDTWSGLIQMEEDGGYQVDGYYTWTYGGDTYTLDGSYYVKEEQVTKTVTTTDPDTNETTETEEDITSQWWNSAVSMSADSSDGLRVSKTETNDVNGNYYYKVTGFKDNATGTVMFTNDLTYATVTILKTDDADQAQALSGATFKVYSDADCTIEVGSGTTDASGTCTIEVPVQCVDTVEQTFYIRETDAPDGYTLYEETIVVSLQSGQKVTYDTTTGELVVEDSNGVYVQLVKYNNVHDYIEAYEGEETNVLSGVQFILLRSEDDGETWTVLSQTYPTDSNGEINFDTLINSEKVKYLLVETGGYDTEFYDGLESVWYSVTTTTSTTDETSGDITTVSDTTDPAELIQTTVIVGDTSYTGYEFSLQDYKAGSLYQLYAYNQPRPAVTLIKEGDGSSDVVPTADLAIYKVDETQYSEGDSLSDTDITNAKAAGTYITSVTTTVSNTDDTYSSATCHLSPGTYLVVETGTSGEGYVIDKENTDEVWYQIIEVPADGTTEMTVEQPFVNVTQDYSVSITKTAEDTDDTDDTDHTALSHDILSYSADLKYTLALDVTATGPINNLTLTDSGLAVTKVWSGLGSAAMTVDVSAESEQKAYLDGDYYIQSVQIPLDASYDYSSLTFTGIDSADFSPNITIKVTFTYSDGSTHDDVQTAGASASGGYWNVEPKYNTSELQAVSFTVTWYDENLETYTGYQLGSDFKVSDAGNDIVVSMHIDQQEGGNSSYYAVAEIANNASVTYDYKEWDTTGNYKEPSAYAVDTATTTVPNVEAPILSISKTVENETTGSTTIAVIGNTLLYTITLSNSSASLAMDNPILLDLLPQGVVAADADDEDSLLANVKITSSTNENSTLKITNVFRARSDGYTLLEIRTSGSLAAGETVTITLEATVDSTVLNYLSSNASLENNVWVTSETAGTVYHDNTAGSAFMGSVNNDTSWAGNYTDPTSDDVMTGMLKELGVTGYGYLSDSASVTFQAASSVNILKEIQGDQDAEDDAWYYGSEGGTVTANTDEDSTEDDGYADFRLTVTNMSEGQDLVNIVLMDIIPKESGASFNSGITKEWDLDFDQILSVTLGIKNESTGEYDRTTVSESDYTVWYYTGTLESSADVTTMQSCFDTNPKSGDWVTAEEFGEEDKSTITAFAVVFAESFTLGYEEQLQLKYRATVPWMNETDAAEKAHLATYNDFRLIYQTQTTGTSSISSTKTTMNSNYVYALLSTEPVGVGGMFWIDADGDGIQDSEDVTPNTYESGTDDEGEELSAYENYNSRTNDYSTYNVVKTLLNSASIQLLTYNGANSSQVANSGALSGDSWRFLFEDLTSANISSSYDDDTAYDRSGILWKALAGASTASWYQLLATIAGNGSIKYSLTAARTNNSSSVDSVKSYSPDDMYDSDNSEYLSSILKDSNFTLTETSGGTTETLADGTTVTTGSTTATSENFFLYGANGENTLWNLSEDIGLVIYRDLKITKKDTEGSNPEAGSTFAVYGPYADASSVTELSTDDLVETHTLGETTYTFKNLLYFQEYIIVETSADDSYDLTSAVYAGDNISEIDGGVTVTDSTTNDSTDYDAAWILEIPGAESDTDPAANNTNTTDNMTVTNAKTLPIRFTKVCSVDTDSLAGSTPLAGATFSLYSASSVNVTESEGEVTDVSVKPGGTAIATATSASDGTVTFTETDLLQGEVEMKFSSGTYYLIENSAPSGYIKPTKNFWVVTVNTAEGTVTLDGEELYGNSTVGWYILNYQTYDLPLTGGSGTRPFTVVGLLLMTGAAIFYFFFRRRRRT